ncbi:MAG: right-handed parallel beta-helix repeat-containing protein [Anaerolineales bacterium]|nr:right-handed parallel beta-helix repeat-containing protein [Anaerolineales bacterium]
MKQIRYTLFVTAVFFALILSAMTTSPALADEDIPPPSDTTTAEETPLVEEVASDETPLTTEETVSELIESLPAETVLVVTDEAGEVIPLASEEAAEAVAFIDPVWCPVGVSPKNGTGGCTTSYTNLKDLIDNLMAGTAGVVPNTNGVIWIQAGPDASSGSMILDGSTVVGNMENFSLTLQGGWNGTFGSTAITGVSTISNSLAIINWNGDITIKDIVFSGVTTSTTPNTAALEIETTKKITLTNVDVDNNTGVHGTWLENNDGVLASDVVITNSTFTENGLNGLSVASDGTIIITNLVANSNGLFGAYLYNVSAATPKAVTILGTVNQTKFNDGAGLVIFSKGAVTVNSLSSNNNDGEGVYIDNTTGTGAVTFTGTNIFRENVLSGIKVISNGAITINNLAANDNGQGALHGYGAFLDNSTASTPMPVKLTGTNEFYSNYFGGLVISSDGAITVNNLTAAWNTNGFGADLRNDANSLVPQNITITGYSNVSNNATSYGMFIATYGVVSLTKVTADGNGSWGLWVQNHTGTLPKAVTISGANSFSNNAGSDGLTITSLGAITLNNIIANNNGGYGAYLQNDFASAVGGITITALPSGAWNDFSNNVDDGLLALSKGNITVAITYAYGNGGSGVILDNNGLGSTGNVTFGAGGLSTWCNGIEENYYHGLYIMSNGTVTLNKICAYSNGDPFAAIPEGHGVYIDNSTATTPKAVTLLGNNSSSENYNSGFVILTKGAVTLTNIYTDANGEYGLYVDNNTNPAIPQNVTINGYGDFNGNGFSGLNIATYGIVLLNNLTADGNSGNGIYVDNATGATLAKAVTIKGYVNVYNNNGDGLYVNSLGAITLANLDAYQNNFGVTLSNVSAPTPMPVMITGGAFTSYSTVGYGMWILSKGAITINVVDAWVGNNATFGWWLDNNGSGAVGGVTLTPSAANNIDFSSNGDYGLLIQSLGAIKVTNLDAWDNGDEGAILDNAFSGAVSTVTISAPLDGSYNNFSGNGLTGLIVYSNRAITVANIIAGDNGVNGAYLSNTDSGPASPQPITISNTNYFNYNGDNGLVVYSFGVITTNNLNANDNGQNLGSQGWGVILDNCLWNGSSCDATSAKAVMLKGTNTFNGNYRTGLWVDATGAITGNNITASNNGTSTNFSGAYLFNQFNLGFFGITLTGSNGFDGNGYKGLWILTNGAVTINNLYSNWNGNDGTYIDSYNATKQAVVKITGNNFFLGNGGTGLIIKADAAVTLNNIMANWNGVDGANIDNVFAQPGSWSNATLTITGNNFFNGNGSNGLYFNSNSHVTISNITADNNDRDVTNNDGSGVNGYSDTGTITISCGSMTENNEYGWVLGASTVTLKGVFATGNVTANTNFFGGTLVLKRTCP